MSRKQIMVVGAGIAGLTAARELSRFDLQVHVIESSFFSGGHALRMSCKARDVCVKCGACTVESMLSEVHHLPNIHFFHSSSIEKVTKGRSFGVQLIEGPKLIDPFLCDGCGRCYDACTENNAILKSISPFNFPPFAIDSSVCLAQKGKGCRSCIDVCERKAIHLNQKKKNVNLNADAVILATGFETFDPSDKPYGYGPFQNVLTHFEMERMLRTHYSLKIPSDGKIPQSISFIQCVGSRDSRIGHLWCSRVCCGASVRMAGVIKKIYPEMQISIFYIDIQNFGKNIETTLKRAEREYKMIRSIPGSVFQREDGRLSIQYFNPDTRKGDSLISDMLVLCTGIVPGRDNPSLSRLFRVDMGEHGFLRNGGHRIPKSGPPVFVTGTVSGPKNISECISESKAVTMKALKHFGLLQSYVRCL